MLGTGSFGRVLLVRKKNNNNLYAMKILLKSDLKQKHQEEHTKTERDLMVKLNSPFIMNIKYSFQDQIQLYIVTEFMQGGDMYFHLHEKGKFEIEKAKFYIIEIILAIEYLHKNNMVYRDLKPENILMDKDGHIKLTDFGLSKILEDINDKTFTMCGTPQYIAPEVICKQGYDKGIDWWSLGCLLYEFLTGCFPFYIPKGKAITLRMYQTPLKFPRDMDKEVIDLICKLLNVNPSSRLGNGIKDAEEIKAHPFFKDVDWDKYMKKEIKPPFIPELEDETDLKYFDKTFTEADESYFKIKQTLSRSRIQSEYFGFTFTGESFRNDVNNNLKNVDPRIEININHDIKEQNEKEND